MDSALRDDRLALNVKWSFHHLFTSVLNYSQLLSQNLPGVDKTIIPLSNIPVECSASVLIWETWEIIGKGRRQTKSPGLIGRKQSNQH